MGEDPRDLMPYNLWLVPSPFLIQQPTSYPPNYTHSAQVVSKNENCMQLPVNNAHQFPRSTNGLRDNESTSPELQKSKPVDKLPDPSRNGSTLSKLLFSENPNSASYPSIDYLKSGILNNPQPISDPSFLTDGTRYCGQDIPSESPRTVCKTCGKWFRSRQQLTQHMLVHTDVRKYQCNFCGRGFKQPSHLQQHHRIHTGEKPYRCPLPGCSRAFPQLSNLNHHLRNHDKPDPPSKNTCTICARTYASEAVLKNHMLKIHMCKTSPRKDVTNVSTLVPPPAVDNHVSPLSVPDDQAPKVPDDSLVVPIKCEPPQHLDSSCSPDYIVRVVNNEMVRNDSQEDDDTTDTFKVYKTIPLEKIRQTMENMNDNSRMSEVMRNNSRDAPVVDPNTAELMQKFALQMHRVDTQDNQSVAPRNIDHRERENSEIVDSKVEVARMVSFDDKEAMASEYWKETTGFEADRYIYQLPDEGGHFHHKEYEANGFVEESITNNRLKSSTNLTLQKDVTNDPVTTDESFVAAAMRNNYNYTLEFLENDFDRPEKRSVHGTMTNGLRESVYKDTGYRAEASSRNPTDTGMDTQELVNKEGFLLGMHVYNQMSREVYNGFNNIGKIAINDIKQSGDSVEESQLPQGIHKYPKMTVNGEYSAIRACLERNETDIDCKRQSAIKERRVSNSRKRKAFQPQRVVHNEEMASF